MQEPWIWFPAHVRVDFDVVVAGVGEAVWPELPHGSCRFDTTDQALLFVRVSRGELPSVLLSSMTTCSALVILSFISAALTPARILISNRGTARLVLGTFSSASLSQPTDPSITSSASESLSFERPSSMLCIHPCSRFIAFTVVTQREDLIIHLFTQLRSINGSIAIYLINPIRLLSSNPSVHFRSMKLLIVTINKSIASKNFHQFVE